MPSFSIDFHTALAVIAFTALVAGGLLLLSWGQHRQITALGLWGAAFAMAALAVVLIAGRGSISNIWSIVVANAMLAAAYGVMWSGARNFAGRELRPVYAGLGAALWLCACAVPAFYSFAAARAILMAAIGMTYTLLTAGELWRDRHEHLVSRWPLIGLLVLHAIALPLRIPVIAKAGTIPFQTIVLEIVLFESMLLLMSCAYLFGSIAKERVAHWYMQDSLIDPLTGIANRRAFLRQGGRIIERARRAQRTVGLLLFDLDRFKTINDRFGHAVGDAVLAQFCHVVSSQLRPADYFARIGGEEFACLLPDTTQQEAIIVAERVRVSFEATRHDAFGEPFAATVSVGVSVADARSGDLAAMLVMADRALYAAKQDGRNRVAADQTVAAGVTPLPRTA
jgi:diguanylate cyclase (GGDEF)-like protein